METQVKLFDVLLIDDDDIANFLSSTVLVRMGFEKIDAVKNGKDACSYLLEKCPRLIFLDISMPVMDGFEFLAETERKGLCPKTYIAMLTSSTRDIEKEKAFSFDSVIDYLEKPLDTEKVERVLARLL